jgi:hypothetical protein
MKRVRRFVELLDHIQSTGCPISITVNECQRSGVN